MIAAAVLAATTVVMGVLWSTSASEASDLQRKVDKYEGAEAAAARERDERPDLRAIADDLDQASDGVEYDGDAESLDVTIAFPTERPMAWLEAFMEEVGMSAATIDRMGQTRALDGTLEAEADHVSVTWTYHPDDGMSAVFSVDD